MSETIHAEFLNASAGALTEIHDIEDLRQRFNQDEGLLRLILLFSPT